MKILILLVVALAVVGALLGTSKKGRSATEKPKARAPLTKNEQPMYFRLKEALPEYEILAQVAFSALITAKQRAVRSTFDRKVADFVVCSRAFHVLAVVELDDSSHKGKEAADHARDALLTSAGYKVLRYKRVPDIDQIRKDIQPISPITAEARTAPAIDSV